MLVWRFSPPDPCKTGAQSCPSQGGAHPFTINFGLTNPPEPDKPGMSINWVLTDPPVPDKPGVSINWELSDPH